MGYERYPRGNNPQDDYYNRREQQDYGRDYGSGRNFGSSSARDYQASGNLDRDDDRYGRREYNRGGGDYGRQSYGGGDDRQSRYARGDEYHGSYAGDGRRFEDVGNRRDWDDDNRDGRDERGDRSRYGGQQYGQSRGGQYGGQQSGQSYGRQDYGRQGGNDRNRGYGRQPQGYDYDERGFMARAGDEVRSWFGDEDAERRREMDSRYDERYYNQRGSNDRDSDYHNWRSTQIAALDRDYDEYRQENRSKFENEFSSWRSGRQTQRDSLNKVSEHDEVVGSDGSHVGTVDKVRGDRILLTKNDKDAGGQHHSIPSSWITSVEDKKVTLNKTADEAKKQWRDEENNQALFRYGDNSDQQRGQKSGSSDRNTDLDRSFSGTY